MEFYNFALKYQKQLLSEQAEWEKKYNKYPEGILSCYKTVIPINGFRKHGKMVIMSACISHGQRKSWQKYWQRSHIADSI
jgi:hypothetical protein